MDSKVDKQIKRYLKRISDNCSEADAYNSTYYVIDYGDGIRATVRFLDHVKSQTKALLDIVKMNSDVYIIAIRQMKYSVSAERVVDQLKSLMLIVPELAKFVTIMAEANDKMQKKVNSLNVAVDNEIKKLRKQYSEAEDLIELYDEIDGKHKRATEEIKRLLQTIAEKDKEIKFLQKRINLLEIHNNQVVNLVNKIITTTSQAKHEISVSRHE